MDITSIKVDGETKGLTDEALDIISTSLDAITGTPLPSLVKNILKSFITVPNYFFAKRLKLFLENLDALRTSEKIELRRMLEERDGEKAGEIILESINSMDDDKKVKLLSILAIALARKEISVEEFFRYGFIIKSLYYRDLLFLGNHGDNGYIPSVSESLNSHGLIQQTSLVT